jgi:hypothetical protein
MRLLSAIEGMNIAITSQGHLALIPQITQEEDVVFWIEDALAPIIVVEPHGLGIYGGMYI